MGSARENPVYVGNALIEVTLADQDCRRMRILLVTNGSGYQIDKCLGFDFFRESVDTLVSDRQCGALDIAKKHRIERVNLAESDSHALNTGILRLARERGITHIISPGFTRIFRGDLLRTYRNRIFNCHPSVLPAFRGFYDTRDTRGEYRARQIFERTVAYGSRVTGNTIHVITEEIDEGFPVIVSTMNIPYGEDSRVTRHHLFLQECKCLLQFVSWLSQERIAFDTNGYPFVRGAKFDAPFFSPNLEDPAIVGFDLELPP